MSEPANPTPARRVRRRFGELPVIAVTLVLVVGLVAVTAGHWRKGMYAVGIAALVGAVLRLVLPSREAGLLVVRSRLLDVLTLACLGAGVVVLAAVVPAAGT